MAIAGILALIAVLLGLLVLGGVVALLVHPRTRRPAAITLGVLVGCTLLLGLLWWTWLTPPGIPTEYAGPPKSAEVWPPHGVSQPPEAEERDGGARVEFPTFARLLWAGCVLAAFGGVVALLVHPATRKPAAITLGVLAATAVAFFLLAVPNRSVVYVQRGESLYHEPVRSRPPPDPTDVVLVAEQPLAAERSPEPTADDGGTDASPPRRPAWIDQRPHRVGDVYRVPVSSGLEFSRRECEQSLQQNMAAAAAEYVGAYFGPSSATANLRIDPHWLRNRAVEEYVERVSSPSYGNMLQVHVLLEFDAAARAYLENAWRERQIAGRLRAAAGLSALVLGALGSAYLVLRRKPQAADGRRSAAAAAGS